MSAIDDAVQRIVEVLTDEGDQPAPGVFERLVHEGVRDEIASRAISSGSLRGAFKFDSSLLLSLPPEGDAEH
ncbi:MAG: hypothetical protein ACJ74U_17600 [Jatrophihabitantaceae bacterium]